VLKVFKEHKRFLFFAGICSFFSGIGQTYLLALFNDDFERFAQISNLRLSFLYSLATFCGSLLLPYLGRMIDRNRLKKNILIFGTGLSLGLMSLSFARNEILLFGSFIFVRLFGQSSLSLCVNSTISKYFGQFRGKVLSVGFIGRSLADGILPGVVIFSMLNFGAQKTIIGLGLASLFILVPLSLWLLKDFAPLVPFYEDKAHVSKVRLHTVSLGEVYKDYRTYLLVLCNVATAFIMTAVFFHSKSFVEYKGWELASWGKGFTLFAIFQFVANICSGIFVDAFGAFKVVVLKYIPLALAIFSLNFYDGPFGLEIFFAFCGLTVGVGANSKSALLGEIFGPQILATIKSIESTALVMATSISPILFSFLIESYGISKIINFMSFYLVAMILLLSFTITRYTRSH
jgi:MFS family permease